MVGAGGLVVSIIAFAVGAILNWAVTVSPYQHGLDINKVGVILMIVGVAGAIVSVIVMISRTVPAAGLSSTTDGATLSVGSIRPIDPRIESSPKQVRPTIGPEARSLVSMTSATRPGAPWYCQ